MNRRVAKKILRRPGLTPARGFPAADRSWQRDRRRPTRVTGRWSPLRPGMRKYDWQSARLSAYGPGRFILDKNHRPVPCPSLMKWGRWLEAQWNRRVDDTILPNGYRVSTIFLGLDHSFGEGPPLIFESMTFPGYDQERYSTWEQAAAGHLAMCIEASEKPAIKGLPS